jgi:hypothetical protein
VSSFIPASPAELTPEWVTTVMRDAGVLPNGRVRLVTVRPLSGGGTGFTGDTVRVLLEYEDAPDAPSSVIAKFPTTDRPTRGMLEAFDAYAREIRFYQRYAHRLPCPTPAYLGADYDTKGAKHTGPRMSRLIDALPDRVQLKVTADVAKFMRASKRRYALLIEDLGGDTTVYDLTSPPDNAQLAAALEELAALHAAFWHVGGLHGDDVFRAVLTTTPGLYQTVGRKRCLALAQELWADWLTVADVAALREALDRFPEDVARVNQKITMIHGDPRSDNILYGADGKVVLLDWSLAGHAHPGYDVAYLLSSCLGTDRIGARHELLERYEGALARNGVEIDGADLRATVAAAYRGLAVQQLMSIVVLNNESYGDDSMYDLWMPRILVGIAAEW